MAIGRANALRKLYPNHTLAMSSDYGLNILAFPEAYAKPLSPSEHVTNLVFIPLARRLGSVPGVLGDNVEFGGFSVAWKVGPCSALALATCLMLNVTQDYDFIVYVARVPFFLFRTINYFLTLALVANSLQHDNPTFRSARGSRRPRSRFDPVRQYLEGSIARRDLGFQPGHLAEEFWSLARDSEG